MTAEKQIDTEAKLRRSEGPVNCALCGVEIRSDSEHLPERLCLFCQARLLNSYFRESTGRKSQGSSS